MKKVGLQRVRLSRFSRNTKPDQRLGICVVNMAPFYTWRKTYGGMDASQLKRLKELEEENRRLGTFLPDDEMTTNVNEAEIQNNFSYDEVGNMIKDASKRM